MSMASAQTMESAVLFSGTKLDNSYLLTENVSVTFDSNGKGAIVQQVFDFNQERS